MTTDATGIGANPPSAEALGVLPDLLRRLAESPTGRFGEAEPAFGRLTQYLRTLTAETE